jgi:hypothetical protein
MDKYKPLVDEISQQTGTAFRPASPGRLAKLRELKCPEAAVRFYGEYEPADYAEGQVRLWPIDDIVVENTQGVPGICVHPHGYLVFASTLCGDAYCFNSNKLDADGEPEIILVSHEAVEEGASAVDVNRVVKPVASSLVSFLQQFTKGELDEECIY